MGRSKDAVSAEHGRRPLRRNPRLCLTPRFPAARGGIARGYAQFAPGGIPPRTNGLRQP
jgi:hypothetical protein